MKNSNMKLSDLTKEFDIYPPAMVEARRLSRQHRMLNESRKPQTGIYFWIPERSSPANTKPGWKLMVFDEEYYGDTTHLEVWSKYVARQLGIGQSRNVLNAYMGLPRGRVVQDLRNPRRFIVFHGNDTPGGKKGLDAVLRAFNLSPNIAKVEPDKHEQRDPRDVKTIKAALKYKQRVQAVPAGSPRDMDLGSDFDDDYSEYSSGGDFDDEY